MTAFLIEITLGVVYFGGLYFSTQKIMDVKYPSVLMLVSFALRMVMLVGVFFYLSSGGYKDMLLALLGVIVVRFAIIFKVKSNGKR